MGTSYAYSKRATIQRPIQLRIKKDNTNTLNCTCALSLSLSRAHTHTHTPIVRRWINMAPSTFLAWMTSGSSIPSFTWPATRGDAWDASSTAKQTTGKWAGVVVTLAKPDRPVSATHPNTHSLTHSLIRLNLPHQCPITYTCTYIYIHTYMRDAPCCCMQAVGFPQRAPAHLPPEQMAPRPQQKLTVP